MVACCVLLHISPLYSYLPPPKKICKVYKTLKHVFGFLWKPLKRLAWGTPKGIETVFILRRAADMSVMPTELANDSGN